MTSRSVGNLLVFVAAVTLTLVSHCPVKAGDGQHVTVPLDVDVYDKPGGEGKARPDFLPGGSKVELLKEDGNHWCNVQGDAVPGGPGWIWCGTGDDGKNYKLIPVADGAPAPTEPTEPTETTGGGAGGGGTGQ